MYMGIVVFSAYTHPYMQKKTGFLRGLKYTIWDGLNKKMTTKIKNLCMKVKEEGMIIYLDQTKSDFSKRCS